MANTDGDERGVEVLHVARRVAWDTYSRENA